MKKTVAGRLKFLIISAIILSALIPASLTTAYLVFNISRDVREKNSILITGLSHYISSFFENAFNINHHLSSNREVLSMIEKAPPDWDKRNAEYASRYNVDLKYPAELTGERLLLSAHLMHPFTELLFLQDSFGNQVARSFGPIGRRGDRWWFRRFAKVERTPFVSNSYFSLTGQVPVVSIFHPVMDGDEFAGVLGIDINFGYIQNILQNFIDDENVIAVVIDSEGVVISHPDPKIIQGKYNLLTGYREVLVGDDISKDEAYFIEEGLMNEEGMLPSDTKLFEVDENIIVAASEALSGNKGFMPDILYGGRASELHYAPVQLPGKGLDGEESRYGLLLIHYTDQVRSYVGNVLLMVGLFTLMLIILFILYINLRIRKLIKDILSLEKKKEELLQFAYRDPLTKLHNRRYFTENGGACHSRAERSGGGLAVMMMDIDHFKKVNDTYGHDCGDYVLKVISGILIDNIRDNDLAARLGGEEFCLLLDGVNSDEARNMAERIRKLVEEYVFSYDGTEFKVTVSSGICVKLKSSLDKMVKKADFLLYESKIKGRNRVTIEGYEEISIN